MANNFVIAGTGATPSGSQETAMPYQHQEWPRWMYRDSGGDEPEGRVFDKPEDVPKDEGWVDSPAKVGKVIKPKPFQKKAKAVVEDDSE